MRHALGMPRRVLHGDGAAMAHADHGKALQSGRVDDGFEIAHPRIQRLLRSFVVGQPEPAHVVAQQGIALRQLVQIRLPHRTAPVELEVIEVEGGPDQRRTGAVGGVGDAYPVEAGAEADLLSHAARICWFMDNSGSDPDF